jgi:hypothetical protein
MFRRSGIIFAKNGMHIPLVNIILIVDPSNDLDRRAPHQFDTACKFSHENHVSLDQTNTGREIMLHKVKLVIALALVPIALFAFCFPSLAQTSWTTHEVLSGTKSSIFHSIAVHKNGTIYIGFENAAKNKIFLASSNDLGADWNKDTVAENKGTGLSLAINNDSAGSPHLCYGGDNATYVFPNASTWEQETIDSEGTSSSSISLEFDSQDRPHVSYLQQGSPNKIRYATRNKTGQWQPEDAVSDPDIDKFFTSMALDISDKPHIVYLINQHLYYNTSNNSSWTNEELIDETSNFQRNDIAVDQTDEVHISYFDYSEGELLYTLLSQNGSRVIDTTNNINSIGKYNTIEIDGDNNPHIAYSGENGTTLKYAYHNGTDWKRMVVSNSTDVNSVSLDLDDEDNAHISYLAANSTLKYATTASVSDSNDANGGGGGGGGCLMTPESSFGAGWLLLLIVPAFALISRRVRS